MTMEEQRTPLKAARPRKSKNDDDERGRKKHTDGGKQASAAHDSPLQGVLRSVRCLRRGAAPPSLLQNALAQLLCVFV